jgi:hypothetical protein
MKVDYKLVRLGSKAFTTGNTEFHREFSDHDAFGDAARSISLTSREMARPSAWWFADALEAAYNFAA